jgi:PAS domain S-box-containing protein
MSDNVIHVLSIEDNKADAVLIQEMLADPQCVSWNLSRFEITHVTRLQAALDRLRDRVFDAVLTDLELPDSQASETVAMLRQHIPRMPLVVLTGQEDEALAQESVRAGVQDYLYKNKMTGSLLARALIYAIERHQAHDKLKQRVAEHAAEKKYRLLIENLGQGVWYIDQDAYTTFVNTRMAEMLGYTVDEMQGKHLFDFMDARGIEIAQRYLARRRQGSKERHAFEFLRKDGTRIETNLVTSPIIDQGVYVGAIASVQDITARKQVEQALAERTRALRESEHKLRSIIEQSSSGIVLCDERGKIIKWNAAQERLSGISQDEALGQLMWDVVFQMTVQERRTLQAYEHVKRMIHNMSSTGQVPWPRQTREQVVQRPDGIHCVVETQVFSIRTDKGFMLCSVAQDVTNRVRAEEALQESEARFRAIFEQAAAGIGIARTDGKIIDVNEKLCDIVGYTKEELLTFRVQDITFPEDYEKELKHERGVLAGEKDDFSIEKRYIHKQGHPVWVNLCSNVIRDEKGDIQSVIGVVVDITPRKQVESQRKTALQKLTERTHALRESEGMLDRMLQTMVDGMVRVDLEGRITYANLAAERILEVHKDKIQRRYYNQRKWQQINENGDPFPLDQLPLALALGQKREVRGLEHGIQAPNGQIKWLSVNAAPLLDESGQLYGAIASFRDITAQKKAESQRKAALEALAERTRALQESEERFRIVSELISDYAYSLAVEPDGTLKLKWVTPKFGDDVGQKITGRVADALHNQHIHPDDVPILERRMKNLLSSQEDVSEYRILTIDGEVRYLRDYGRPVWDEGAGRVVGIVGAAQDISARARAEQEIARYAAELERSNEDLEQFAYVISHDLREPLRMIESYLNLLRERYGAQLDAASGEFIDYAVDGAERMQDMIRALLDLSRVGTRGRAFAPTDVEGVLARTIKTLSRPSEEAGAEVTHDPLPTVMADEAQLVQVFQNLIANGIKFCRDDVPPRVHVSARRQEDEWVFSVADNGIGIDPTQTEHLFQIFQRLHTRDEYPGTGIGLALCRRIVERHGGRIWVESEPGHGATFHFSLPEGGKGTPRAAG